jgi:hypothetical protein
VINFSQVSDNFLRFNLPTKIEEVRETEFTMVKRKPSEGGQKNGEKVKNQ